MRYKVGRAFFLVCIRYIMRNTSKWSYPTRRNHIAAVGGFT